MVSKIAVIALVAIVATPILLGFAFNLSEVSETDYRMDGDTVNVTPLLRTGTHYTTTSADTYQINSKFYYDQVSSFPKFKTVSTTKSSSQVWQGQYDIAPGANIYWRFNHYDGELYAYLGHNSGVTFIELDTNGINPIKTVSNISTVHYYASSGKVDYSYGSGTKSSFNITDQADYMFFRNDGTSTVTLYISTVSSPGNGSYYASVADGYYFRTGNSFISTPAYTKTVLMTMDLSAYPDNSLYMTFVAGIVDANFYIYKGSVYQWYIGNSLDPPGDRVQLYYDNSRSSNTYQILITYELVDVDASYEYYNRHVEFRYVGDWPTLIGYANYYKSFSLDYEYTVALGGGQPYPISSVQLATTNSRTPLMRMDDAVFRAFSYPIIENQVYTPASFRTNPATTIDDPEIYGPSFVFGGNTYTVSDGKITIGSHRIPVKGLVLSSILNENGTYDNRIGNTIISTTAQPSTITFNGMWSASISTQSMEEYTYTKTEWHAGSFGWDGIDQNFLIVGLITCLGAFVGLGIYARKRGTGGLIPLMIVTGCAAAVFFIML